MSPPETTDDDLPRALRERPAKTRSPASPEKIALADSLLSFRVPPPLRRLYEVTNGAIGPGLHGIALSTVGAMLGFLVGVTGGCDSSGGSNGACSCPPPPNEAVIHLGCLPVEPPVVKTTGPCSVCPVVLANGAIPEGANCAVAQYSQNITLIANDAGTCHVELTFAGGATSSVDLDFSSVWRACGSDPHGCGEGFIVEDSDGSTCGPDGCQASVPEPVCDAGLDAGASD